MGFGCGAVFIKQTHPCAEARIPQKPSACLTQVVLIWNNSLDKQFLPDTSTRFPMGSYITSVLYGTIVIYKEKVTGFIHPVSEELQWKSSSSTETTNPTQYLAVLFTHDSAKMHYVNVENRVFRAFQRKLELQPPEVSPWCCPLPVPFAPAVVTEHQLGAALCLPCWRAQLWAVVTAGDQGSPCGVPPWQEEACKRGPLL